MNELGTIRRWKICSGSSKRLKPVGSAGGSPRELSAISQSSITLSNLILQMNEADAIRHSRIPQRRQTIKVLRWIVVTGRATRCISPGINRSYLTRFVAYSSMIKGRATGHVNASRTYSHKVPHWRGGTRAAEKPGRGYVFDWRSYFA